MRLVEVAQRVLKVVLADVAMGSLGAGDEVGLDTEGVWPRDGPCHGAREQVVHEGSRAELDLFENKLEHHLGAVDHGTVELYDKAQSHFKSFHVMHARGNRLARRSWLR